MANYSFILTVLSKQVGLSSIFLYSFEKSPADLRVDLRMHVHLIVEYIDTCLHPSYSTEISIMGKLATHTQNHQRHMLFSRLVNFVRR